MSIHKSTGSISTDNFKDFLLVLLVTVPFAYDMSTQKIIKSDTHFWVM